MSKAKMFTEIHPPGGKTPKALLISPHGDDGQAFLDFFPEIKNDVDMDLFTSYLAIERDLGATELAYEIAKNIDAIVFTMDYPRGIIDGGRKLSHCLRRVLPARRQKELEEKFLAIHKCSLDRLKELYKLISDAGGIMLDIHTMASFSPENKTIPITSDNMKEYVGQFVGASRTKANQRRFDIITSDDDGNYLADPKVADALASALKKNWVSYEYNVPYAASKEFTMHQNLLASKGVCLDIPKHLLSKYHDRAEEFRLEAFEVDPARVSFFAQICLSALAI